MGKPGTIATLESTVASENHAPGRPEMAAYPWGVLSGIVLGGGESPLHGEGPDGSTQPAKETRAGQVGSEHHGPTSLRGIGNRAKQSKDHRFQNLSRCLNAGFLRECWHDLNKAAASGVDGITAAQYQENLESNIQDLAKKLENGSYRAKLIRRCYIPKEKGKERPLGIPALEDKLVQLACAKLLNAIFEEDFMEFSYGYRPGRGAKDAVADLTFNLQYGSYGYVVEADIQGFFDHIDHGWLLKMLEQRIDDRAFLNLIRKWLKAGILDTDGKVIHPEEGTPQGGIISPVLANVYLHYALDLWFEKVVKKSLRGEAMMCRYADDFVCAFRYQEDAETFYQALPERLGKFGLKVAPEKTKILRFSRFHPGMKRRFAFLGFEFYWYPDRQGTPRVKRRTARKKLLGACRRIKDWIKENRHLPGRQFIKELNRRLQGHYQYFGIRGNSESIFRFFQWAKECAFKWLNRRGGKKTSFTWEAFSRALERLGIARPSITEPKRPHRVFA
jgi:group II intron reverse transcriptase/maturase